MAQYWNYPQPTIKIEPKLVHIATSSQRVLLNLQGAQLEMLPDEARLLAQYLQTAAGLSEASLAKQKPMPKRPYATPLTYNNTMRRY